jgi:hypothetical protein
MSIAHLIRQNPIPNKLNIYVNEINNQNISDYKFSTPLQPFVANQTNITLFGFLFDGTNLLGIPKLVESAFQYVSGTLGTATIAIMDIGKANTYYSATFNSTVTNPILLTAGVALPASNSPLLVVYSTSSTFNWVNNGICGFNIRF